MAEISSSGYKEYAAGLFAGVAAVATGHPFDTVKVQFLSTCFYVLLFTPLFSVVVVLPRAFLGILKTVLLGTLGCRVEN